MVRTRSHIKRRLHRLSLLSSAIVIACVPLMMSIPAHAECTPPEFGAGVHQPVGADAATYTYNCDSGLYENAHYTFNPATGEVTPKDPPVYTYNSATGQYDSGTWLFNAPTGTYVFSSFSVSQPPANATVVGAPAPPPPATSSISNTGANSNNTINNDGNVTDGSSISNTGDSSNNTIDGTANNNQTANNGTTISVNNNVTSDASTGNAIVLNNTNAGSATSGSAQSQADIINLLQSTSNSLDGDTVTFVANIDGDVEGDFMLDPSLIGNPQQADGTVGNNNLTINNETDASINNTIDLTAESGDATVANNTNAGDATSGTAKTIANIINVINSAILSGKSVIGTININGNLNGDILIPDDFVDQLIAANVPTVTIITNTGANSNNAITNTNSDNTAVTNTDNTGITNNVNAVAESGDASVTGNTNAGSATSGEATNSITAFNLTGKQIIGCNAVIVFVNVMGEWTGLIVNAPPGATAAALGSCVKSSTGNTNTAINNDSNLEINNDINSTARSGDATVANNTRAGSARTGSAQNAVNLLNINNSVISLDGQLILLFINVFKKWNGSFGINTAAGNKPIVATGGSGGGTPANTSAPVGIGSYPYVFNFVPSGNAGTAAPSSSAEISNTGAGSNNTAVLAASKTNGVGQVTPQASSVATQKASSTWIFPVVGLMIGALLLAAERVVSSRQRP